MSFSSNESQGTDYLKEIREALNRKDHALINNKVNNFTKYLFSCMDRIYSELNDEFERSDLMVNLFDCIENVNEQYKRDILRLLNLFLKTNRNLRHQAISKGNVLKFLLKNLTNKTKLDNLQNLKYYVNLSSYLLLNNETRFDTEEIRKLLKRTIVEMNDDDSNRIVLMMLHSSSEINAGFNNITHGTLPNNDGILSKHIIGIFIEWIRDYIHDFKSFYEYSGIDKSRFDKFNVKIEFGFDQICQCLIFYAKSSHKTREDIYQSGLYDLLSLILSINSVPEHFISNAIEIFEIPCIDSDLKDKFRSEHSKIIERFVKLHTNSPNQLKDKIENFLNKYKCSDLLFSKNSPSNTLPIPNDKPEPSSNVSNIYESLNVDKWLSENNLEACRKTMSLLTGRGLKQLKSLLKENDGKFQLIELLTSKLNLDLITVLELLGALESCDRV